MPTLQHVRFQKASFKQSPWPQIWTSKTVMIGKHSAHLQRAGNLGNHVGREKRFRMLAWRVERKVHSLHALHQTLG